MRYALRHFLKDSRGVAAIEFVLVLPMMLIVLFAIYELGMFVRVNMQMSNAATSIADLVSQQANGATGGTGGSLGNFCKAGKLMMTPFPTSATSGAGTFSVAIASVTNYTSGGVTLDWESDGSCSASSASLGSGAVTAATSPVNLVPTAGAPGDSVIVVQVTYSYGSPVSWLFPTLFTLTETAFARPRDNTMIACSSPCT